MHKSSYIDQNRQCTVGKSYTYKKKRLNTEGELLTKKECLFPNIQTKNTKLSFQQSFFTEEELKNNLKMEDIQKRLYKMRNSKIGKKILVINAYGI